ncbi:MAG: endonuclease Q family protein, partial [Candidatus Portnoybacteria bacterium]|nr:endonuclease Q family protein [Candidatus Portnoybacteria bacterium]
TGDALHPVWRREIGELLEDRGGALYLKDNSSPTAFCLSTEVSCIYKRGDKTRRLHHVILFPDLASLDKVIQVLDGRGFNLKSDGRPIMGLDSEELLKILLDIDPRILLIPAHAWTPWFAIFGSKSGFDSLEECFGENSKYIYAIETGLSSDPPMNWRVSALDRLFLISNSDAHSNENLGREANVFEMEKPDFAELRRILVKHDNSKFLETLEFFPEEGMYHVDGHADCKFYCEPEKTKKLGGRCPNCGKLLTVGVLSRVNDLADRPVNPPKPPKAAAYRSLVPLRELIAEALGKSKTSKTVQAEYEAMLGKASEFAYLMDLSEQELSEKCRPEVALAVSKMRRREVEIQPGYDGIYGKVRVRDASSLRPKQSSLL